MATGFGAFIVTVAPFDVLSNAWGPHPESDVACTVGTNPIFAN